MSFLSPWGHVSERAERQCRQRAFDPVYIQQIVIDVFSHVFLGRNIHLEKQVILAAGRVELGMDFAQGDVPGDTVSGAGFASDLDEDTVHGTLLAELCRLDPISRGDSSPLEGALAPLRTLDDTGGPSRRGIP